MIEESNSYVTVAQFVTTLIENYLGAISSFEHTVSKSGRTNYIHYGYQAGWLEDMDITGKDEPLLRKNAARIIHEFIRLELQIPDINDVSCATKLRDLYDCRVCTKHVMQVYARGIMKGYYASDTLYLFGMNESVSKTEMDEIISRIPGILKNNLFL